MRSGHDQPVTRASAFSAAVSVFGVQAVASMPAVVIASQMAPIWPCSRPAISAVRRPSLSGPWPTAGVTRPAASR